MGVCECVCVCVFTRVIQKVLSLTQKEEPRLNIFVVATHYQLEEFIFDFSLHFFSGEAHIKVRSVRQT